MHITPISLDSYYSLPVYDVSVSAGFPSPADDFIETKLDLNEHLVKHPAATFFVRVSGEAMADIGIRDGDILVVDRSLDPQQGDIVVAVVDGEMVVKKYPLSVGPDADVSMWGIVTFVIHKPQL